MFNEITIEAVMKSENLARLSHIALQVIGNQ